MSSDVFEIEGFDKLNEKLKLLPDKIKRNEVVKLQRRLLKPAAQAYERALPEKSGNIKASVKIKTVASSKVGGNPVVQVLPDKNKKADGYYRFMIVKKGTRLGSRSKGSRKGKNTVTMKARDRAYKSTVSGLTKDYERKMAKYIQRRIDSL